MHCRHQPLAGTSTISSVAPSAMLPRVTASKQKRRASGCTDDRRPISNTTSFTRWAFSRRAVSSTICSTPSASDISCIVYFQRIGQTGIKRQYRLIECLSCLIQANESAIRQQRDKRTGIGKKTIRRRLHLIAGHLAVNKLHGMSQATACRQRLADTPSIAARRGHRKGQTARQRGRGRFDIGQTNCIRLGNRMRNRQARRVGRFASPKSQPAIRIERGFGGRRATRFPCSSAQLGLACRGQWTQPLFQQGTAQVGTFRFVPPPAPGNKRLPRRRQAHRHRPIEQQSPEVFMQRLDPQRSRCGLAWRLTQRRMDGCLRSRSLRLGAQRKQVRNRRDHAFRRLTNEQSRHRGTLQIDHQVADLTIYPTGTHPQAANRSHSPSAKTLREFRMTITPLTSVARRITTPHPLRQQSCFWSPMRTPRNLALTQGMCHTRQKPRTSRITQEFWHLAFCRTRITPAAAHEKKPSRLTGKLTLYIDTGFDGHQPKAIQLVLESPKRRNVCPK